MKDTTNTCQHNHADNEIYKEVVVIGNGPSGMVTSFMLAGNVPYLKHVPADLPIDDMLRARLANLPAGQSLYEADLMALAEGLEGRSQNPIPLLMDNLLRPCADLGIQADPLIEWKHDVEKQIEHVVLGRGPAGGSWHTFPSSVRTLSPAAWLALPPRPARAPAERLSARRVAHYCTRYVAKCKLQKYFRCNVIVQSVTVAPPHCTGKHRYVVTGWDTRESRGFRYICSRVVVACGAGDRPNSLPLPSPAPSPTPALAPPPAPAVPAAVAEQVDAAHLTLAPFERAVKNSDPSAAVLVVGSGVSAADAVWLALRAGRAALHLHRAPAPALARLPPDTYPDYCQVYRMMCDGPSGNHENYTPFPHHVIVAVTPAADLHKVTLLDLLTNDTADHVVSTIGVFIGSKPDLFFLQTNYDHIQQPCACQKKIEEKRFFKNHWLYFKTVLQSIQNCRIRYFDKCNCENDCKCDIIDYADDIGTKCACEPVSLSNGIGFGVDETKPVDSRNPIAIDKSTHELLNSPKGVYALGPVTADNFVRFIPGGALALVAHIHRDKE